MLPQWSLPGRSREFADLDHSANHTAARKAAFPTWLVVLSSAMSGALVAIAAMGVAWNVSLSSASVIAELPEVAPWTSKRSSPGGITFEATKAEQALGDLTAAEVRAVALWVMARKQVDPVRTFAANSTWIAGPSGVELVIPAKSEVLAFFAGEGPAPLRFARVTLVGPGTVIEYSVGPLESGAVASNATMKVLRGPEVTPYTKRPTEGGIDGTFSGTLLHRTYRELGSILTPAWGHFFPGVDGYSPETDGSLNELERAEALEVAGTRADMFKLLWIPPAPQTLDAFWVHPVPLDIRINTTHQDPSQWEIMKVFLCNAPYNSTAEIIEKHKSGTLNLCPFRRETGAWDWPQHETPASPAGRVPLEPHGGVKWGPWKFTVTSRPSTGFAVVDVKFNDERVVYELSLQDAAADYSGTRHTQFFYSDAAWSLAMLGTSLEPGVDCPEGAHYLQSTTWYKMTKGGGAVADATQARELTTVCIFEWQEDHTVWRHMVNSDPPKVHGLVRGTIVVRSITTVGNYDYITDLKFREDGEIEVSTKFAGFLETRYFDKNSNAYEKNFSTIFRGDVAGPVHSHLVCFKADIDVAGVRANTLSLTKVKTQLVPFTAGAEGVEKPLVSKYVEKTDVAHEGVGTSTFVANPHAPAVWSIVDRASAEKTGNPRGYAVVLNSMATTQVLPDDHPFVKAMPFTKYHLAVTRHHDDEYRATSPYIHYDGYEHEVNGQNLDRFLEDGENLLDEDLVAWIGFGREHITRQEDLPLVSNFGAGFSLQPWNFFERNIAASPLT